MSKYVVLGGVVEGILFIEFVMFELTRNKHI